VLKSLYIQDQTIHRQYQHFINDNNVIQKLQQKILQDRLCIEFASIQHQLNLLQMQGFVIKMIVVTLYPQIYNLLKDYQ